MIRVCHITSAHKSDDDRIFRKECVSLSKAGYEVSLVAQGESRNEAGVHVVGIGEQPQKRLKRMFGFAKEIYIKALELDCDIYHLHDPELLPYAKKLKKHGKVVIFDSHENHSAQIMEREYLPAFTRKTISKIYRLYEISVIKKIDAVITPCTFAGKNIFENYAKCVSIIANYSKLEEFYDKYSPDNLKEGYVCYTGSISLANGVKELVLASYKANVPFVLAGGQSSCLDIIKGMPEFENVKYMGHVNQDKVIEIMSHASIGAYVNRHIGQNGLVDTFGIKVYEFMAMGLPIIVDDTPYAQKVINKYHCGICVKPQNVDELVEALQYYVNNPDTAHEMGMNGREAVKKEFNWSTQEKILLELYLDLETKIIER